MLTGDLPADSARLPKQTRQGVYPHRLSEGVPGGDHQPLRVGAGFFRPVAQSPEDYAVFTTAAAGTVSHRNACRATARRSGPVMKKYLTSFRKNTPVVETKGEHGPL